LQKRSYLFAKTDFKPIKYSRGDKLLLKVENDRIILELVPDPLSLALKTKKWTKISVEEFEEDSEREQHELYET